VVKVVVEEAALTTLLCRAAACAAAARRGPALLTSARCHRKIVLGVTIRGSRQVGDSSRVSAANTARSAHDSRGRLTWQRSTATSAQLVGYLSQLLGHLVGQRLAGRE
jgi:hypothetical protein